SKLDGLRLASGVIVAMRVGSTEIPDGMLEKGDVIHAVNGIPVSTPEGLRTALTRVAAHGAVVLQIERAGQFSYGAFERDSHSHQPAGTAAFTGESASASWCSSWPSSSFRA